MCHRGSAAVVVRPGNVRRVMTGQDRWNAAYAEGDRTRSWYQPEADVSLDLIASGGGVDRSVVDVGGGASVLVGDLVGGRSADVVSRSDLRCLARPGGPALPDRAGSDRGLPRSIVVGHSPGHSSGDRSIRAGGTRAVLRVAGSALQRSGFGGCARDWFPTSAVLHSGAHDARRRAPAVSVGSVRAHRLVDYSPVTMVRRISSAVVRPWMASWVAESRRGTKPDLAATAEISSTLLPSMMACLTSWLMCSIS